MSASKKKSKSDSGDAQKHVSDPACSPNGDQATCVQGHDDHASHVDLDTKDGRKRVAIACVITAFFTVIELVGGLISGSLALIADAAHMLTDSASLALAWIGYWFATKAPDETRSYGFGRMRVLAAFTNGIALIVLAAWIMVEALLRLLNPQPVIGGIMLWVAVGGLVINFVAAYVLHGGDKDDINLSGAFWHVIGDLLGSVAAIIAAIIIITTSWTPIDPLLSMLVSILVILAGVRITQRAGHILVQGSPDGLTSAIIRSRLVENIDGIQDAHSVHVWQITEDKSVATVCVVAKVGACTESLRQSVKHYLENIMQLHIVTVEVISEAADSRFKKLHTNKSD